MSEDSDDYDEDDDSSLSDESVRGVQIQGCGLQEINGFFRRVGDHDECPRFSRVTEFRGREEVFSLFRCRLTDNTRRWYISIVPKNIQPGTNKDTDFYLATATGDQSELPDSDTWMTAKENGTDPAPKVIYKCDHISDSGEDPIDQSEQISGEHHQHTADTVE